MIAKEILKKVKKIHLKVSRMTNDAMSGHYLSVFKGIGIEFDKVREYLPGDDVRSIDWNVTARTGKPFVKSYVEERELTLMLMVDLSASQYFGTVNALKSEIAAEISALLAFLAIKNNDKVGLLIFSDHCERYLPPQKGRRHVLRVIREILGYAPKGRQTKIPQAINFINQVLKHRSIVFLISDFMDQNFEKPLKNMSKRHDVIAVKLTDPRESDLPAIGLIELEDNETSERILLDTSDPLVRKAIQLQAAVHLETTTKLFRSNKVDCVEISTNKSYLEPLQKFFYQRERRIR